MKWVLIGLGALVVIQVIRNNQTTSRGGALSPGGGSTVGSGGLTGFVNSLSSLTSSIGKLFNGGSSTVTDRDALINPDF